MGEKCCTWPFHILLGWSRIVFGAVFQQNGLFWLIWCFFDSPIFLAQAGQLSPLHASWSSNTSHCLASIYKLPTRWTWRGWNRSTPSSHTTGRLDRSDKQMQWQIKELCGESAWGGWGCQSKFPHSFSKNIFPVKREGRTSAWECRSFNNFSWEFFPVSYENYFGMLSLQTGPGIPADLLAQMRKVPRIPSPSVLMGPPNPPESRWDALYVKYSF